MSESLGRLPESHQVVGAPLDIRLGLVGESSHSLYRLVEDSRPLGHGLRGSRKLHHRLAPVSALENNQTESSQEIVLQGNDIQPNPKKPRCLVSGSRFLALLRNYYNS